MKNKKMKNKKMKTIFTVTGVDDKIKTRIFGFFFDQRKAIDAVLKNTCDIFEYRYENVVIEEVKEGIHANLGNEIWFKWNWENNEYERSEKPSSLNNVPLDNVYCFGIA